METAALLHDLDKALATDDPLRTLGHGHAGARWLIDRGFGELAPAVDSHPVGRLNDGPYEDWVRSTTIEQRIVAYADKRAHQRVVTLDRRFGRWTRRHPENALGLVMARERAALLEAEDLRSCGGGTRTGGPKPLGHGRHAGSIAGGGRMTSLAYIWGEDAWSIDRAARDLTRDWAGDDGTPLETWRASLDDDAGDAGGSESGSAAKRRTRLLDEIGMRLASSTMFGGGTLVVVRQPGVLLRETAARERTTALLGAVAPGNGLCFVDLVGQDAKGPAASGVLRDAVAAAGGVVRELPALTRDRMESWLTSRARELGVRLGPGAAQSLALRVGAYVREGDVDRRRQSELANGELEKLALYRPEGEITRADIEELVPEAIPASTWAFLDAIAARRAAEATALGERLLTSGTPLPVIVGQIHRRLRDLIMVREHLDAGTRPAELVKQMRLQPFRAQKLAEQAATWTAAALDDALSGLLELDLRSKGISLTGAIVHMDDAVDALGLQLWIAEHAVRVRPT